MKKLLLMLALLFPIFLFFNVWQVFQHKMLEKEIRHLMEEQQEWYEANKRKLVDIARLQSPSRIRLLADELGLEKPDADRIFELYVDSEGERNGQ